MVLGISSIALLSVAVGRGLSARATVGLGILGFAVSVMVFFVLALFGVGRKHPAYAPLPADAAIVGGLAALRCEWRRSLMLAFGLLLAASTSRSAAAWSGGLLGMWLVGPVFERGKAKERAEDHAFAADPEGFGVKRKIFVPAGGWGLQQRRTIYYQAEAAQSPAE